MGGEIAVIPMLGFVWIVVVVVGIWVYDRRRQERLMWEARIRAAVDEAIAQMAARQAALTPPVSPPPAPVEAAAPVSPKPVKPPPPPLKPATADTCPHCRAQALVESLHPAQPATPVIPQADSWANSGHHLARINVSPYDLALRCVAQPQLPSTSPNSARTAPYGSYNCRPTTVPFRSVVAPTLDR